MPLIQCLGCGGLFAKGETVSGRCQECAAEKKAIRNASARELGPCPQDGLCWSCGHPARAKDPLTWGHFTPISEGGTIARPQHLSENSAMRNR